MLPQRVKGRCRRNRALCTPFPLPRPCVVSLPRYCMPHCPIYRHCAPQLTTSSSSLSDCSCTGECSAHRYSSYCTVENCPNASKCINTRGQYCPYNFRDQANDGIHPTPDTIQGYQRDEGETFLQSRSPIEDPREHYLQAVSSSLDEKTPEFAQNGYQPDGVQAYKSDKREIYHPPRSSIEDPRPYYPQAVSSPLMEQAPGFAQNYYQHDTGQAYKMDMQEISQPPRFAMKDPTQHHPQAVSSPVGGTAPGFVRNGYQHDTTQGYKRDMHEIFQTPRSAFADPRHRLPSAISSPLGTAPGFVQNGNPTAPNQSSIYNRPYHEFQRPTDGFNQPTMQQHPHRSFTPQIVVHSPNTTQAPIQLEIQVIGVPENQPQAQQPNSMIEEARGRRPSYQQHSFYGPPQGTTPSSDYYVSRQPPIQKEPFTDSRSTNRGVSWCRNEKCRVEPSFLNSHMYHTTSNLNEVNDPNNYAAKPSPASAPLKNIDERRPATDISREMHNGHNEISQQRKLSDLSPYSNNENLPDIHEMKQPPTVRNTEPRSVTRSPVAREGWAQQRSSMNRDIPEWAQPRYIPTDKSKINSSLSGRKASVEPSRGLERHDRLSSSNNSTTRHTIPGTPNGGINDEPKLSSFPAMSNMIDDARPNLVNGSKRTKNNQPPMENYQSNMESPKDYSKDPASERSRLSHTLTDRTNSGDKNVPITYDLEEPPPTSTMRVSEPQSNSSKRNLDYKLTTGHNPSDVKPAQERRRSNMVPTSKSFFSKTIITSSPGTSEKIVEPKPVTHAFNRFSQSSTSSYNQAPFETPQKERFGKSASFKPKIPRRVDGGPTVTQTKFYGAVDMSRCNCRFPPAFKHLSCSASGNGTCDCNEMAHFM